MRVHWTSKLPDIAANQLPFAIANALNDTAKAAAVEARAEAGKRLNIRRKSLLNVFVRAPNAERATKRKLSARVMVAGPQSDPRRGTLLTQHEQAGDKTPIGGRYVAIPGRDIRKPGSKREIMRGTELRNFRPFINKGSRVTGGKNTFIIRSGGIPMLLQRQSRRVRVLWLFVKRSRLTAKLGFHKAVGKVVRKDLTRNIGTRLTQAIATSRQVTRGGGVTSSRR